MRKLGLILILLSVIISCKNFNKAGKDEFILKGKIQNADALTIYLHEVTPVKSNLIDSVKFDSKGEFVIKRKIRNPGLYDLMINKNNFIRLLIANGETIEITGDAKLLAKTYAVSGSEGSVKIKEIFQHYFYTLNKIDSISSLFKKSQLSPDFLKIKTNLDSAYKRVMVKQKAFIQNFISNNLNSLSSLIAIFQRFGQQNIMDLSNSDDSKYFLKLDSALMQKYPENLNVIEYHKRITDFKRDEAEKKLAELKLQPGNIPPDINLPDMNGKMISLSSLKGKVVLIDFWASWCKGCRMENPLLTKLYKKYKTKGFEIYAVSFDKEKNAWKQAIEDDKLVCVNVSDLKYWSSPIVKVYNIEALPYSVLLNKEGKIIMKGIYGKEFEDRIAKEL